MDIAVRSMSKVVIGMRTTYKCMVNLSRLQRLTGLRICHTESLLCTTQSDDFQTVKSQQPVSTACSASALCMSTADFLLLSCDHVMPNFELEPVILSLGCCLMRHKFSLPKATDWFKTPKTPNKHALGLFAGSFIALEPVSLACT